MALSHGQAEIASGTGTTYNPGTITQPALNDLVIVNITAPSGTTINAPSDNSSGGGAWTLLDSLDIAGHTVVACYVKTANAQDHANLTTISGTLGSSVAWTASLDIFTGFSNPATRDLFGTFDSDGASVSDASIALGGVPEAAEEIALYIASLSGAVGTLTDFYSPDGGVTQYAPTTLQAPINVVVELWAHPTTTGVSPEFTFSWASGARVAKAMAATFYSPAGAGDMLLVL